MANNINPSVKNYGKQIGDSGTVISGGIITLEEYNTNLIGLNGLKIYDTMRRSDGTVHAALQAVKLPILSIDYDVQPASDAEGNTTPQDEEIAAFVKNELFNRNVDWHAFMREATTFFDFGHSVFEKTYELTTYDGKDRIGIKNLGSRKQRTILFWALKNGDPGIQQQLLGTGIGNNSPTGIKEIPRDKLIVFTNEKEGDNYQGISLLRFCYKHWDMKDKLDRMNVVGLERMSGGVPVLRVPRDASESEKSAARIAVKEFRNNESAYIELPSDKEGWDVEMLDMKANTAKDVLPSVEYHDKQILLSVLAQFLNLGSHGSSGSRAVSEDHSQLFMLSEEAAVKTLVSTIQKELIEQLCDLNFTDLPNGYPKLMSGRVADDNIASLSTAINQLMTAGALTADPELEGWVRENLHAPELSDEMKDPETYKESKTPAPSQVEDTKQTDKTITKDKKVDETVKAAKKLRKQFFDSLR